MSGATVAVPVMRTRQRSAEARRKDFLASVATHSVAIALAAAVPAAARVRRPDVADDPAPVADARPDPAPDPVEQLPRHLPRAADARSTEEHGRLLRASATLGVVLSSVPVAYALAVIKWRGQRAVFLLVIATMMLPTQVTIVPLYLIFVKLHWIGSLKPLIVPAFFGDAFSIFLLRQFFLTIPRRARGRRARGRGQRAADHVARGGEDREARDRRRRALPVPLLLERLLPAAALHGEQPEDLDVERRAAAIHRERTAVSCGTCRWPPPSCSCCR